MSLFYVSIPATNPLAEPALWRVYAASPEDAACMVAKEASKHECTVTVYPGRLIKGYPMPLPFMDQGAVYEVSTEDGQLIAGAPHGGLIAYSVAVAIGDMGVWRVWAPTPEGAGAQVLARHWDPDWRWLVVTDPVGRQWHVIPHGTECLPYYIQPERA